MCLNCAYRDENGYKASRYVRPERRVYKPIDAVEAHLVFLTMHPTIKEGTLTCY